MSHIKTIIALLFALAFVSCGAKYVPIEIGMMAGIQQLYESKQYDAVIAQLEPLLEKHPTDVKGHHTLIKCYAEKQQLEILEVRYKQAVAKHPKTAALWDALGYVYYWQGIQQKDQAKFREAVKTMEYALKLEPNIALAHGALGSMFVFLLEPKNLTRGIEETKAVIQLTPPTEKSEIAKYYFWLGVAYAKKGMYENAREAYQTALQFDAKVQGAEKKLKGLKTVEAAKQAVANNSIDADAHFQLGEALSALEVYAEAIEAYQKAIELGQRHIKNYRQLGIAYFNMGSYDEAIGAFEAVLQIDQKNADVHNWLRFVKAKRLLKENPNDVNAQFEIGNYYYTDHNFDDAIAAYKKALEMNPNFAQAREWIEKSQHAKRATELLKTGIMAYKRAYHEAFTAFNAAIEIYRSIGNQEREATILGVIGNIYYFTGDYQKALEYYQQALMINKEIGDREGEANNLGDTGSVYSSLGDYQKALEYHQQAFTIDKEIGYREGEAADLGGIGNIYYFTGDYQKALEYHQQALTINKEIGDREESEANNLGNIGCVYTSLGDYQKALEYHQQALKISKEIGYRDSEATQLGNIGNIYYSTGDYQKALEYYQQALTISKEIGSCENEANQLGNMGVVYVSLGDYPKALEYHQQALTIAKKIGDRKNQANQLGNIGVVYTYTDDCQKALEYYQQALTIAKEIGDKNAQAVWLGNIGFSHQELQEYTWALDYLNQALQLSRELGIRANEACLLGMLGITHKSLNNFEQALQYLQAGLQLTQTLGIPAMWACHFFIGIIAEKQGKPEEAVTHYKQAVEKIESVREKLKTKEVQTSFMRATKKTEVYERLIKLLIELGREEEALEYLERSKSEQLKDAFGRLRGRTEDKEEQRKLDEFGQLKERLIALETQLLEAKSGKAVENLTIQIAETKEQLEQFLTYLKDEYPELHGFLIEGNGVFKSVDYLRAQLPKGTLLIEYCLLEDFLAIFLVTSESFESKVVIVKRLQIDELVWKYRESFMQRSHRYNRDGDKLYEYLIKPIESEIEQAETVTVVPNGSLYYLPFHALSRKDNVGNRQFLLEWKRISYLSAATLLDLIQRGRADAAVTAIASGSGQGGGTREVIWASLNMLRAVIDTKLVASATIVSVGHSAQILDTWPAGKFQIVTSPQIIEEMRRVLFYERIRKRSFKHSN